MILKEHEGGKIGTRMFRREKQSIHIKHSHFDFAYQNSQH